MVEGTLVISSLNVTFTYPTAQPKDTICKKFTDSWHFHPLFLSFDWIYWCVEL